MEFWGVEVPSGKPLTCKPGADSYVHVSQAALGDSKSSKGNERVVLKVKVGSTEVVVGTLSQGKCDQTTLDLIFEKDFILSHNSSGSVYFCGYKTDAVRDDVSGSSDEDELDDSEDEFEKDAPELRQPAAKENGKLGLKPGKVEALANKPPAKSPAAKVDVLAAEAKQLSKKIIEKVDNNDDEDEDEDEDEDDDDDDEDDEDEEDDDGDDMLGLGSDKEEDDSDEGDSDDEEESEEEQLKPTGKKRSVPTEKLGLPSKKSKIGTPGKPELKLPSVAASTPKQQQQSAKKEVSAKKNPGKENAATPPSGKKLGQYYCEPCKKSFNSESALGQHKTAKHK